MKKILFILLSLITINFIYSYFNNTNNHFVIAKEVYVCPMHPEIVRDKPGVCPICNMHLVKKQNKNKINYEHNHNLLSKEKNKSLEINNDSGIISNISLYDLKLMNVEKKVKALGKIVHNQEKVYRISSLYEGRIEKLYFNFEGQKLNKGDKILEIYSPDIASAQKEYKQIYNYYNNLKINKSDKDILDLTKITLDAIERKLTILGLNKNQINNIIFNKDTDYFNVPIYSSKSGIIMRKNVEIGQYIKSGEVLFEIVDHSKLWLEADIYESDIKDINLNQVVNININSLAKNIKGKISFIDNTINPKTNTLKVRINVDNYDYTLKPNMISSIDILLKYKNVIAIPKSSLVINGNKNIVWVKKADNIYEPKEVKVNFETDDYYVISSGLSIKDKIVQNGAFLLDSESKISLDNKN